MACQRCGKPLGTPAPIGVGAIPGGAAAEPTAPMPPAEPTLVGGAARVPAGQVIAGRYELVSLLGRGGVGAVYRAFDRVLRVEVAIKVLQADLRHDPQELERFKREVNTAREVTHPNVIRIHDLGMAKNEAYISMEILSGGTLASRLEAGLVRVGEAAEIGAAVAEGLQAAHERGIIHRDIKPENVLFDARTGRPKISDFGLARFASASSRTVGFSGTPYYMSPEQCDGREASVRSDLYSLGVLLFELFTGRLPFLSDSLSRLIILHASEAPPEPRSLRPEIPPEIERLILACLEKDPARRPGSAGEVARALAPWRSHSVPARAPASSGAARRPSAPTLASRAGPSRKGMPGWLVGWMGAVTLAGLGVLLAGVIDLGSARATPTPAPTRPAITASTQASSPRATPTTPALAATPAPSALAVTPTPVPQPTRHHPHPAPTPAAVDQGTCDLSITGGYASVYLDDKLQRYTVGFVHERVQAGAHRLRLVAKDGTQISDEIVTLPANGAAVFKVVCTPVEDCVNGARPSSLQRVR